MDVGHCVGSPKCGAGVEARPSRVSIHHISITWSRIAAWVSFSKVHSCYCYCLIKDTSGTLLQSYDKILHQTVILHAPLEPASLAINDLEVGSDCLHGPRCWSKSCGETSNTFLRRISITKHETIRPVSRKAQIAATVGSTDHLNHICRVKFMNLKKV